MVVALIRESTATIVPNRLPRASEKRTDKTTVYANSRTLNSRAITKFLVESIELPPTARDTGSAIWTIEENNRVLSLFQLMLRMRSRESRKTYRTATIWGAANDSGKKLIDAYRSLDYFDEKQIVPCDNILRDIVSGLVDVFWSASGCLDLSVQIKSLMLQERKRRALALLVSELVVSMLLHGAQRRANSRLMLSISHDSDQNLDIKVETSCPLSHSLGSPGHNIVCALAGILEAEISYGEAKDYGTRVELLMPI